MKNNDSEIKGKNKEICMHITLTLINNLSRINAFIFLWSLNYQKKYLLKMKMIDDHKERKFSKKKAQFNE